MRYTTRQEIYLIQCRYTHIYFTLQLFSTPIVLPPSPWYSLKRMRFESIASAAVNATRLLVSATLALDKEAITRCTTLCLTPRNNPWVSASVNFWLQCWYEGVPLGEFRVPLRRGDGSITIVGRVVHPRYLLRLLLAVNKHINSHALRTAVRVSRAGSGGSTDRLSRFAN